MLLQWVVLKRSVRRFYQIFVCVVTRTQTQLSMLVQNPPGGACRPPFYAGFGSEQAPLSHCGCIPSPPPQPLPGAGSAAPSWSFPPQPHSVSVPAPQGPAPHIHQSCPTVHHRSRNGGGDLWPASGLCLCVDLLWRSGPPESNGSCPNVGAGWSRDVLWRELSWRRKNERTFIWKGLERELLLPKLNPNTAAESSAMVFILKLHSWCSLELNWRMWVTLWSAIGQKCWSVDNFR